MIFYTQCVTKAPMPRIKKATHQDRFIGLKRIKPDLLPQLERVACWLQILHQS